VAPMLFFSGCCALVFQVAWMRELRLVFGATTAAVATVLAIFMGGLGVGSAILGKRAERARNPLMMYGLLEAAVAISVALSPWLIGFARDMYIGLGGQAELGFYGATIVRVLLAAVVMGVPTFLMGGTLPAAVRSVTRVGDDRRLALSVLYGVNTLGAVTGSAIATFFALENLGTRATLHAGCAVNLLVGVFAYLQSKKVAEAEIHEDARASASQASAAKFEFDQGLLYGTAAVLGFTFFVLEMVWYRMLSPILGGTTFTFGLILCVALFGIGVGGAAYNFVFRWIRPTWAVLAATCAFEAAAAAVPYAMGDRVAMLAGWFAEDATSFSALVWSWCKVMSIVVLPVALISGLQFPLLLALLGRGRAGVGKQLGMAYAWNTLGAIIGSLVGGFGAMPLLTAPGVWRLVVVILVLLSACLAWRSWRESQLWTIGVAVLEIVALVCIFQLGPTAAWRHSGIGAGRVTMPYDTPNDVRYWLGEQRRNVDWEADGIESSIAIGVPDGLSFIVNGKTDGNAFGDSPTQVGAALVAAIVHPEPKRVLVIGLGTGETAGWMAEMPGVEEVDVVELEPAIDEMARRVSDLNHDVLNHAKVRRIYNDGREHVVTAPQKYDLIISEPSNPYRAGVAALYTSDFYRSVKERLNPGGMLLQWMQAYEIDHNTLEMVLSTLRSEFEHVEVWQTLPTDVLLVCSPTPRKYSVEELRARIGEGELRKGLHDVWKVDDLEGLLAHFAIGPSFIDELKGRPESMLNTDDRTILEYGFAKTVGKQMHFSLDVLRNLTEPPQRLPPLDVENVDWDKVERRRLEFNLLFDGDLIVAEHLKPREKALAEAYTAVRQGDHKKALEVWPRDAGEDASDVERLALASSFAELGRPECLPLLEQVSPRFPAEAAYFRATYFHGIGDNQQAADAMAQFFELLKDHPFASRFFVGRALELTLKIGTADPAAARRFFDLLAEPLPAYRFELRRPFLRLLLAARLGDAEVVDALEEMEPNVPWMEDILARRAEAYRKLKHPLADEADRDWQSFLRHKR
jgi:spermidine synthase